MKVLQLIDSFDYIHANCFQHQLLHVMKDSCDLTFLPLSFIDSTGIVPSEFDCVISTLKQRSLLRNVDKVAKFLKGKELVIYDQDPWEAFRDGSEFKGSYYKIADTLNVKFFAVTTKWWSDFLEDQGFPSRFVRMWMLPEYCTTDKPFTQRKIKQGFMGTVHPYRKHLFDFLATKGHTVTLLKSDSYSSFLSTLSDIQIFVHSENVPITIDGAQQNLGTGLWIKDVEAAARGAFSIRNRLEGEDTYLEGLETVKLYDSIEEVPGILESIRGIDSTERQDMINRTVQLIKDKNSWVETVQTMIS